MRKLEPVAKLYLLVAVLCSFVIGIGVYSMLEMNMLNQNTHTMYADRVLPVNQLGDIRFSYGYILYTAQQSNDHKISPSGAARRIQQSEDSIHTNWRAYLRTYLTPEEKKLAGQVDGLLKRSDTSVDQLKQALIKNDTVALSHMVNGGLYNNIVPAIDKIMQLLQLQIKISGDIYQNGRDSFFSALNRFIILIIASLAFVLPFSYFLVKNIKNLIRDLHAGNVRIKAAEEKYRSFIKYAGDTIYILDEDLNVTEVNDSGCTMLGYTKKELLKIKIQDLFVPEEKEMGATTWDTLKQQGYSLHERKWLRKDGSTVETEVNVRRIEGGYISVVRDIGERKKAELALKESEEKYRHLFNNNPAYIIVWDIENLKVLEINDKVIEKYGYTRQEFKQMTVLDFRHPVEHEKIKTLAAAMLDGSEQVMAGKWVHLSKSGEEMLMEISSHRIVYHNRNAILSLGNDVTEKVNAQQSLRKSQESFRTLIDHAADGIFMVDDSGTIFDTNLSAAAISGYSKEELIGMSVLDLHPKEVRAGIPGLWDQLRKNKSLTDERLLIRKDGTQVEVRISRGMLPDSSGAIAIVQDITARKKAENRMKRQNEKLLEIAFLQSHIVRRPAANIMGLINLFNTSDYNDPLNVELIRMMEMTCAELDNIINEIVKKAEEIEA